MAGIALFDRDDIEEAAAAGFVTPNPFDIRHAAFLDLLADQRSIHNAFSGGIIRRWAAGTSTAENRLVSVVNVFDANHRLGAARTGVVTGPFAERTFGLSVGWIHPTFDDDFRIGRKWKPGGLPFNNFDGSAFETARVIEFGNAVIDFVTGYHEQNRVLTNGNDDRARLAALEVFIALDAAVLAGRNIKPHAVLVVHHAAISAEINPAFVRIARGH